MPVKMVIHGGWEKLVTTAVRNHAGAVALCVDLGLPATVAVETQIVHGINLVSAPANNSKLACHSFNTNRKHC